MAIYRITSLNYMTAGPNRVFLNMDTMRGYELRRPVAVLRNEEPYLGPDAVSAYCSFEGVSSDWARVSSYLSSYGGLDDIGEAWGGVSSEVSAAVLRGMVRGMTATPLSALCSDVVTEQRDGTWYKTDFLARKYRSGDYPGLSSAMAATASSDDLLLNETQRCYGELSGGHRVYVRLYPEGYTQADADAAEEFNAGGRRRGRTFVMDVDLARRSGAASFDGADSGVNNLKMVGADTTYPMYDMVDVHVKSANETEASRLRPFDAAVTGRREDIYLPQLRTDPLGHCQVKGDAYMLTEAVADEPGMLESSLARDRKNERTGRTYTVQIRSGQTKTYLYGRRPEDGAVDVKGIPRFNLDGIEYNNVTQFPQGSIHAGYSEGNEYGYIVRGKNAMDSVYNMNVSADGQVVAASGCRDYAGVGRFSGDRLYFKFFDGARYSGLSSDRQDVPVRRDARYEVPYQKIECAYINQYTSANLHKSRLFSVKMNNTELAQFEGVDDAQLEPEERAKKKVYSQIMQDIRGAVREIVENLQPSHTQLFRVMFDG